MDNELIVLLDGTRDRGALTQAMRDSGAGSDAARRLAAGLARLADLGLLVP